MKLFSKVLIGFVFLLPSLSSPYAYHKGLGFSIESINSRNDGLTAQGKKRFLASAQGGEDPFETGEQVYGEDFVAYGINEYGEKYLVPEEDYSCSPDSGAVEVQPQYEDSKEYNDTLSAATNMTPFNGASFRTYQQIQITATLTDKSSWLLHKLDVDFYMFFLRGPGLIKARLETESHLSYRVDIYEYDVSRPYHKPEDAKIQSTKFTNANRTSVLITGEASSARTMYVRVSSYNDSVDGDSPYLLTVELKTHNSWFNKGEGVSLKSQMDRPGTIGTLWTEQFLPEGVSPTPFRSQDSSSSCLLNMYDPLLSEVRNVTSNSRACTAVLYLWDEEVKALLLRFVRWANDVYHSYIEGEYGQNTVVSLVETATGIAMYVAGVLISSSSFSYLLSGLSLASDIVSHVIDLTTTHRFNVSAFYYLGTLNGSLANSGDRVLAIPFFYKIIGSTLDWSVDSYAANAITSFARDDADSVVIPYIRPDSCFEGKVSPVTALSELSSLVLDRDF